MTQMHEQDTVWEEEDKEERRAGKQGSREAGLRAVEMEKGRQQHCKGKRVFLSTKDSVNNESCQKKVPNRTQ